jgi:hypothetical protein
MIMSSLSMRHQGDLAALDANATPSGGRLSAFLQSLIAGREKAARQKVAQYLAACSDERLGALGLGTRDIEAIRAGTFNGVRG